MFEIGQTIEFRAGRSAEAYEVRDYYGRLVDRGVLGENTAGSWSLRPRVEAPGWYKLYLTGEYDAGPPWGRGVGGTCFVVFRPDPRFPPLPGPEVPGGWHPSEDQPMRGVLGMGPQRHFVQDAADPRWAIRRLRRNLALDERFYLPFDPRRRRRLMATFPNGTADRDGVRQIVAALGDRVTHWEPRNEPNDTPARRFVEEELAPFYEDVKSVDPALQVMGPGIVSVSDDRWLDEFFAAGGGDYLDVFSFHAYNDVNGDVTLARGVLRQLDRVLERHGLSDIERWQTEQGYFAAVYGLYQPRHQGAWTMLQFMIFEQHRIPKEQNHLWYDRSHGFWDTPAWWQNGDGSLNPAAPLVRVWSEELYGKTFTAAADFGPIDNRSYLGNHFAGPDGGVLALMANGNPFGTVTLAVRGADSLIVSGPFGRTTPHAVESGRVVLPVSELPSYVRLPLGVEAQVLPHRYGPKLTGPHTRVTVSGRPEHPRRPERFPNRPAQLVDGVLECHTGVRERRARAWMGNGDGWPMTVRLDLDRVVEIAEARIYCPVPWSWDGTLLDYELQYLEGDRWHTLDRVVEPTNVLARYTPAVACTADSFFSDRHVFAHRFNPVHTRAVRLLIHDATHGGAPNATAHQAGGQAGPHQPNIREIELYGLPQTHQRLFESRLHP
ncbi:MAG: hypothetical protein AAF800_04570 [Planctomycetota bacterium]